MASLEEQGLMMSREVLNFQEFAYSRNRFPVEISSTVSSKLGP
jgi:hypothetical protein